ncbi:trinucleotide repeat-containing gene 6B protein-like isoform X1 [Xyrauchen texanus]|uniref:trinucleotide repeat-containing gene 6B protein-like isoform X1 n=1 Tax=Xyrauchen texanus TaxID=154827 RepID=UPI002242C1FC|nr:trinucleotide repeat-containing gene 6B protein-like isoform X1 [Xyrauchen texanus]
MEDKKRKKEDKKKRETSQKVVEQKNKVPELTKPPSAQSPATPNSTSPSPGPVPSSTPSAATPAAGSLPQGGNNAKRLVVANGQPSPSPQSSQRYMPREVPPRFRCQQDHKVLLKRGQPPLSSMLLGGGNSGADSPNETVASASDPIQGPVGPAAPSLPHTSSSSSIAASTSNYANSMWGTSSGSQPLSQGREKMIVDRSDLEEWPSIAAGDGLKTGDTAGTGGVDVSGILNSSASWGESYLQQQAKVVGGGNGGRKGVNSDSPSPPTSSSSPNECMQSGSVWASSSHELIGGNAVAAGSLPSISKATPLPGNSDGSLGVSCGIQGANFTPNADPSAWPALVQDGAGTVATEGGSSSLQSSSLSASNALSVNQSSHQHQLHQMQSRDRETSCGKWGSAALEPEAGPKNTGVTEVAEMNSRTTGVGDASSSSSTSSSLWKAQPFPANSKMGSSRTESWKDEAGVSSMSAEGGNAWRFTGQEDCEDLTGASAWGTASGGQTSGLSQGAWGGDQILVGEWGTSGGGGGVSNPAGQDGLSSKSSSSSSGGSVGNPTASSSTPSTMTKAWDNQKGVGDVGVGDSSEWGGQGSRGGGGTSSSSGGGNSRSGSQRHGHHRSHQPPNPEVALENLLSRSDLDPRVLSNSGWGQTQIRQNVAWDFEGGVAATPGGVSSSSTLKAPAHTQPFSGSTGTTTTDPSSSNLLQGATLNANLNSNSILGPPSGSPGENWDNSSSSSSSSSLHTRGPPPSNVNMHNPGISQSVGGGGNQAGVQGKPSGGWGGTASSEEQGKGWDSEGHEWRERRAGSGASGWGDFQKQVTPASGGSGWGESQEDKGSRGWKDMGRGDAGNWGQRASTDWGENEPKSCSSGWGGGKDSGGTSGDSEVGKWGNWDDGAPRGAWGAGGRGGGGDMGSKSHQGWGGKMHPSQMPNSQLASQKGPAQQQQQSQPQQCQSMDTGAMQGGWGRPGGPSAQSQSSGWTSGPIPQNASGPVDSSEPSGWEEPSPQSISRKMEIDDGTSAWGDPNNYNYKSVNLWDKNNPPSGQAQSVSPQQGPPSLQQQPTGRMPSGLGNRDMNLTHSSSKGQGTASSGWGGSGSPSSPCVDNGTAAWGKPTDAPTGWGDPEDTGKTSGWGDPSPNPVKSGSKSMQEGWGEGEGSVSVSRHSSWEDEDESGGVWNNACSQGSSSSYNSGGWGAKKGSKGSMKGAGDSWMNPMTRQFSKMGMLGEDPNGRSLDLAPGPPQDKKLEGEKRGMCLNEYNGEMHKGGRAGTVFRSPGSKEIGACEPGPYYDKTGGQLFSSGGGMAQPRHQPGVSPINPSVRAQVPHQFLSPQVPGSVLKQMPPPTGGIGGVGGGMFPPQLSPQHIAMLSSIYPPQIQFQLACQLLLQQQPQQQQQQQQQLLQNQRKFPPNIRQQADPQQLARIMAVLQQQRQQQVGGTGGSSKLSPSHLSGSGPKMPMSDPLSHSGLAGSVVDLHQKTPGSYSGFGPGVSLSGLELGPMVGGQAGLKDNGGQQSRFKWMMEGHSPAPSPPDSTLHKNGPIAAPLKMRGGSPYSQYELLGSEGLCVPPQGPSDHWHRSPGNKMGTKTGTSSWPPEFQPGVPWKGIQSVDPESDPYITPGSMLNSSMSSLNDTEHQLLRDNTESNPSLNTLLPSPGAWPYSASESPHNNAHNQAKYPDYKPSWPPEPIGHNKPWKTNRNSSHLPRPPPGLTHQKQPSVSPWAGGGPRFGRGWGGSGGSQENRFGPGSGAAWSEGGSSRGSCWLVLSNLTPQIDGSTLRTICMQHGPLLTFHLGLTQGSALIRYSTRQEAAKAQGALHMCVLGNTTILAEFVSEEEVARYFAHSQAGAAGSSSGSVGAGGAGSGPVGLTGSSGAGAVGTISSGSADRERAGVGSSAAGASNNGGGTGPTGSNWQSLDGTGSSPDPASAQGAGLSIFAQWSSNGAGGSVGSNAGVIDPGRAGLWGGMTAGYTSSSLWGSPAMEDRHQMSSPAALLPGDLLGGGADSI